MKRDGKLVRCDNCDNWVFLERLEDTELDGGYTRVPKYEPLPDGWECYDIIKKRVDLCPHCAKMVQSIFRTQMPAMAQSIGLEMVACEQ